MNAVFIQIDGGLFNVNKIQAIDVKNNLNKLGKENGEYLILIYMENNVGSTNILFADKKKRNDEFNKILNKLREFGIRNIGKQCN